MIGESNTVQKRRCTLLEWSEQKLGQVAEGDYLGPLAKIPWPRKSEMGSEGGR